MFSDTCFNEMYAPDGAVRAHYQPLAEWLTSTPGERITQMLRGRKEQLLRTAYLTAVRGDAQVVNHLARRVVETKAEMPSLSLEAPAGK